MAKPIPEKVIITITRRLWRMPREQWPGRLERAKACLQHTGSLNERAVVEVLEGLLAKG